jgi:hypothetical protein
MLAVIRQPYVFALVVALLTAALAYAYSYVTDRDRAVSYRTFFKTLVAAAASGMVLTYLTQPGEDIMATEPFDPLPPELGGI